MVAAVELSKQVVEVGDVFALNPMVSRGYVDTTITSAQILALLGTPVALVPAPVAGTALYFEAAIAFYSFGGTGYTIGGNTGFGVYYDSSGVLLGTLGTAGFVDQGSNQGAVVRAYQPTSGSSSLVHQAGVALNLQAITANVTAGNGTLKIRTFYRVLPTAF
jgi:hypothetical protein